MGGVAQFRPPMCEHTKKRTLKNKSISISFDEKNLRDFVTGFHKRKKKRRREAKLKQAEVFQRKRIQERKQRKLEREYEAFGGVQPTQGGLKEDEEEERTGLSGTTMTYEDEDTKVTVVTSDIIHSSSQIHPFPCTIHHPVKAPPPPVAGSTTKPSKKNTPFSKSRTKKH